jgi:hypothetical protein
LDRLLVSEHYQNHNHISDVLDPPLKRDEWMLCPEHAKPQVEKENKDPLVTPQKRRPVDLSLCEDGDACRDQEKEKEAIGGASLQ